MFVIIERLVGGIVVGILIIVFGFKFYNYGFCIGNGWFSYYFFFLGYW